MDFKQKFCPTVFPLRSCLRTVSPRRTVFWQNQREKKNGKKSYDWSLLVWSSEVVWWGEVWCVYHHQTPILYQLQCQSSQLYCLLLWLGGGEALFFSSICRSTGINLRNCFLRNIMQDDGKEKWWLLWEHWIEALMFKIWQDDCDDDALYNFQY